MGECGRLKLADFGVSQTHPDPDAPVLTKANGTPAFMAPETAHAKTFDGRALDIWAAGVTLYMFLTGVCVFAGPTPLVTYENIEHMEPEMQEGWAPELVALMQQLLQKDPAKRITMPALKEDA